MKTTLGQLRFLLEKKMNAPDASGHGLALCVVQKYDKHFILYHPKKLIECIEHHEEDRDDNFDKKDPKFQDLINKMNAGYNISSVAETIKYECDDAMFGFLSSRNPRRFHENKKSGYNGAFEVALSAASPGFGPLLYEIAMSTLGGLCPDRDSVSSDAYGVWQKFMERDDIEKRPIDNEEEPQTPTFADDGVVHPSHRPALNYTYHAKSPPQNLKQLVVRHVECCDEIKALYGLDRKHFEILLSQGAHEYAYGNL